MPVDLHITDVAMIAHADVRLGDLVVLLGPNDAGKSTLATIIYAVCRAQLREQVVYAQPGSSLSRRLAFRLPAVPEFDKRYVKSAGRDLVEAINSGGRKDFIEHFPESIKRLMRRPMEKILQQYAESVGSELEHCFGESLQGISRKGRPPGNLSILVRHNDEWTATLTKPRGRRPTYKVEVREPSGEFWENFLTNYLTTQRWRDLTFRLRSRPPNDLQVEGELAVIFDGLHDFYFRAFPVNAHYLPAARSGILHSHRALAAALVRQSSFASIEGILIPTLPGTVTDFIGKLIELNPTQAGPYSKTASQLEDEILHGKIELQATGPTSPEIRFAAGTGANHALHRTSSMVSELAPVVLFLRHVLHRGDLLLIEEPESHLHPLPQVRFAQTLARLVAGGARVVITTHSDYFLNQLNNLIKLNTLRVADAERGRVIKDESEEEGISSSKVNAYLFAPGATGTEVKQLAVTRSEGISDADFAEVADWLYNESASLAREITVATS